MFIPWSGFSFYSHARSHYGHLYLFIGYSLSRIHIQYTSTTDFALRFLLHIVQNELRRHNERIQVLNQRVIEVDNRVANSISKISLESEDTNINADLKKESDISLETSGNLLIGEYC